ncbi:MAG: hypothetical protein O9333_08175 [Beijerinckiaceae bacterium]|nr:hypothetical protein [Beijerinckiaceae bacterium]
MSGTATTRRATPFSYAVIVALAMLSLGPILVMVATSLKTKPDIFSGSFGLIFMPTLDNYRAVLGDSQNARYLTNSLIVATFSTGLTLVFGCMAAYAIVRFRFFGRDVVSGGTLLMRMVPPAVLTVPVFMIWT